MLEKFYPKKYYASAYIIDYKKLYEAGCRGLVFDIDNTLVKHGAPANESVISLFRYLHKLGFKTCLISNNKNYRVAPFAEAVGSPCIINAHKPSTDGFVEAMYIMGTGLSSSVFIGDQLFTDIYGANRTKMYSILVKPIGPKEEIQIVFKRIFEKIVLHRYKKDGFRMETI
ncbi:YqeG family HAD IIIA-type phosphatase [Parasporobacterium paucivorans]|uniref:YqeG family HAD IIIA-type phosphatase n=1 Tax=Parasporobacterium paucivorans DSM 15970 TaxID=1122934 RepID=A0A1M6G291_9FIRM|nr:HAD family hydrolase [Parasporobacterium paucivorans]SHJ04076.1 hypothetical protein SAMN02745691_01231 [Parasporobacterium paucivorans DSM 15970]